MSVLALLFLFFFNVPNGPNPYPVEQAIPRAPSISGGFKFNGTESCATTFAVTFSWPGASASTNWIILLHDWSRGWTWTVANGHGPFTNLPFQVALSAGAGKYLTANTGLQAEIAAEGVKPYAFGDYGDAATATFYPRPCRYTTQPGPHLAPH